MRLRSKQSGFSLIELLTVIAVIAILLSISSLAFNSWQKKADLEAQTREMRADIVDARARSLQQKKEHRITFQPTSYVMKSYSSENEPRTSGTTVISKNLRYTLTLPTSNFFTEYDIRGLMTTNASVPPDPTIVVTPLTVDSAVNCIVIASSRINIGKMNGATCEFK